MAWIESHQELARHPKTRRLARLLGASLPAAIGHLQLLWWWAMDFAPDGSLSQFDETEIAEAMMWEGDPNILIEALEASRFIDKIPNGDGFLIHDWDEYAGRLIERRRQDAERKRMSRRRPEDVTAPSGVTVPNRTGPDSTQPDRNPSPNPSPLAGRGLAKPNGRRRREDPDAIAEPPSAADRELWAAALAKASGEVPPVLFSGLVAPLEPVGRGIDGGLRLRAPPNVVSDARAQMTHVVTRILQEVGDEVGARAAIIA